MPRTPRRILALLLAGAALASLAACAPAAPAVTDAPSASPRATETPIFASDEEALAAAVAAYEHYLDAEQRIVESDDVQVESIAATTTSDFADELIAQFESLRSSSLRLSGRGQIDSERIAEFGAGKSGIYLTMYACSDVSDVRVIDASGVDVTPERAERVPVVIEFEGTEKDTLLVAGSNKWSGDDFC
ncbi:MAG TPA: hypothetical protein VFS59_02550 [Gemmatimonadaceae bacterium]|nr:hypothetical protein [Gemmatimonadaceae bacterium]